MDSTPSLQHQISLPLIQKPSSNTNSKKQGNVELKDGVNGKRGPGLTKTYSVHSPRENRTSYNEANVFDKLPLRPSLVAQISSESQKIINKLKNELNEEQKKNKEAMKELEDLQRKNQELKEQFELYKQETSKLIEELTQNLHELEERSRYNRHSKELTDDTISSSEAGKYSEVINKDSDTENEKNLTESGSDTNLLSKSKKKNKKKDKNNDDKDKEEIKEKKNPKKMSSQKKLKKKSDSTESDDLSKKVKTKNISISNSNNTSTLQVSSLKLPSPGKKESTDDNTLSRSRSKSIDVSSSNEDIPTIKKKDSINTILTNNQWVIDFQDLHFIDQIGKGCASTVYLGTYKSKNLAIKVLRLENRERDIEDFKKEMEIMSSVKSPYIVDFYGACFSPKPCIALELCVNGTLFHYMQNDKNMIHWGQAIQWMIDMTRGINTLHQWTPQIVHRDLKTLNLLLDSDLNIKVCDFGLSRFVSGEHDQKTFFKMRGTYAYIGPEVYKGCPFTSKSDVYSIGIILWEIVHRVIVGKHMRPYGEYPKIIHDFQIIVQAATRNLRPTLPPSTPAEIEKVFSLCINSDPDVRPSCEELLEILENIKNVYNENKEKWDTVSYAHKMESFPPPRFYRKGPAVRLSGKELVRNKHPTRNLREDLEKKGILLKPLTGNDKNDKDGLNRHSTNISLEDHKSLARFRSVSHSSVEKTYNNNNNNTFTTHISKSNSHEDTEDRSKEKDNNE